MDVWNLTHLTCFLLFFPPSFDVSRQAWALVSVVGGGNASCSEDVKEHENLDTGGRALARRNFTTVDGVGFSVTAYSEWKNGEKCLTMGSLQNQFTRTTKQKKKHIL